MVAPQVSSSLPVGMMHSPGFDGGSSLSFQMLMNADSLYTAAHCALLLNLKLSHGDYYRKRPTLAPGMMVSVNSGMGSPTPTPGVRSDLSCHCTAKCRVCKKKLAIVFCALLLSSTHHTDLCRSGGGRAQMWNLHSDYSWL